MSDATDHRVGGGVPFVDGVTRDVYEDADGRQWVVGSEGEKVYGVQGTSPDGPVVVATEGKKGLMAPWRGDARVVRRHP